MPNFTIDKLRRMHESAKRCDEKTFAEQRTNILLRAGDHYNKQAKGLVDNFRTKGNIATQSKIRLVKNHIHRITNLFINSILEGNPSVTTEPYNENEIIRVNKGKLDGWVCIRECIFNWKTNRF